MADNTGIEWTDATWNPIRGCSRVSDGCRHCYAETQAARVISMDRGRGIPNGQGSYDGLLAKGGQWNGSIKVVESVMEQPLRWKRPRMIFVNSMSDLFHENVPCEVIDRIFDVMARASQHTFQILTKRPARMRDYLDGCSLALDSKGQQQFIASDGSSHVWPLPNVWIGVSIEDQASADERIPMLLDTPAAVRWLSMEPLLGPVDIAKWLSPWTCSDCCYHGAEGDSGPSLCSSCGVATEYSPALGSDRCPACGDDDGTCSTVGASCPRCQSVEGWSRDCGFKFPNQDEYIHWVVVGGESGVKARPMHPDWARSLRDQCADAGVPFLFKQWGEWAPGVCVERQNGIVPAASLVNGEWQLGREDLASNGGHEAVEPDLYRIGKRFAGRLLDGNAHDGYPRQGM